jgi:hypothetical protein
MEINLVAASTVQALVTGSTQRDEVILGVVA